jgi:CO/xanthine dehydrogenase Mo-binding subunit
MALLEEMIKTLKGLSVFTSDISMKNCYHGLIIASPIHKGGFVVKKLPALSHGNVYLSAGDIPGKNKLSLYHDSMPFLAEKRIQYKGQPLCLLCGPDKDELKRLAAQIQIDYHEETPCLSVENYTQADIIHRETLSRGDVEKIFAGCAKIIEGEFRTDFEEYQHIEPQAAIAFWDKNKLSVYCTTKNLFYTRNSVADFLHLPKRQTDVLVPDFVQDQGEKQVLPTLLASFAGLLSMVCNKPVKISYDNTVKRYPCIIRHKTALDANRLPVGMKSEILLDAGAFNIIYPNMFRRALFSLCGAYDPEHLEINACYIRTNKVPFTRFLNTGALESFFAIELHTSNIARICESDPFTLRNNMLRKTPPKSSKPTFSTESITEILGDVTARADFLRKYSSYEAMLKHTPPPEQVSLPRRGIGLSLCFFGFDFLDEVIQSAKYSIKLTLRKNNNLTIYTSALETDQSLKQLFASIASRVLGIGSAKISFESQNTQNTRDSGPLTETRVITHIGKLLEQGCTALLAKKKANAFPVTVIKSNSISPLPENAKLLYDHSYRDSLTWCAFIIEVEIDPVTLEIICKNIWVSIEAGTILEPEKVRMHLEKEILSGLRSVGFRQAFKDHKYIPSQHLPPMSVNFLEKPFKHGPLGAKGIGELPSICVAPAYVAAVSQAIGINISKMPLIPEHIEEYLEKK